MPAEIHQAGRADHVNGSGRPSTTRRTAGAPAARVIAANGFAGPVQSPSTPTDSGTTTQTTSQNTVGRMFSGTSWLPNRPASPSRARTTTDPVDAPAPARGGTTTSASVGSRSPFTDRR